MRIIKVPNPCMILDGYQWKLESGRAEDSTKKIEFSEAFRGEWK